MVIDPDVLNRDLNNTIADAPEDHCVMTIGEHTFDGAKGSLSRENEAGAGMFEGEVKRYDLEVVFQLSDFSEAGVDVPVEKQTIDINGRNYFIEEREDDDYDVGVTFGLKRTENVRS